MTYSREIKTIPILIVQKNLPEAECIAQKLRATYTHLFATHHAANAVEAMEKIIVDRFDCVLLGNGFSYREKVDIRLVLQQQYPAVDIPVIELDYRPDQLTARVFKAEAADYILKSHPDSLQKLIREAIRKNVRETSVPQLRIQYREAQRHLYRREKQIAKLKMAIETGKEMNQLHELELKKTLRRLTFQFENTPLAVVEWDETFRVRRWSGEAENLFGWKSKEVLGKKMLDFPIILGEESLDLPQKMANLMEGVESKNVFQGRNYHKNGQPFYAE